MHGDRRGIASAAAADTGCAHAEDGQGGRDRREPGEGPRARTGIDGELRVRPRPTTGCALLKTDKEAA